MNSSSKKSPRDSSVINHKSLIINHGFTLIELLVTIALFASLIGLVTFNLIGVQKKTNIRGAEEMIIAEMRSQQAKAMNGIGGPQAYGIHIDSNKYTLFSGSSYNSSDPENFVNSLDGATLETTFDQGNVIFQALTGEVNFSGSNNTITVHDLSGSKQEIITVNKYGTVTNIQ